MSLGPGSTIGPFKIQSLLGKGGMGEVFSALDTRLDRKVALKILPPDFATDAGRLRRFQSEAKTLASLNHPNILSIFEVGTENGTPYLVSELLEGRTLREELGGPLPVRKATDHALQIAHGLAAAHGKGVVHRDLKPENIFITKDGRVKILDFGLAKLKDPSPGLRPPSPHPLGRGQGEGSADTIINTTEPGVVLGTPAYMSPEQVRGESADHSADIFAFGAVLYEMLSGTRAFRRDTPVASMNAVLSEDPPELGASNANISPTCERIVRRCLEKQAERRFHSAHDLAFALEALGAVSTSANPVGKGGRVFPPHFIHWAIAMLAIALAVGAFFFRSSSDSAVRNGSSGMPSPLRKLEVRIPLPLKQNALPRISALAISPDGRKLAFVNADGLWIRRLDQILPPVLVSAGDNVSSPFWSPRSTDVAWFGDGTMKRVPAAGGRAMTICRIPGIFRPTGLAGGAWLETGEIIFGTGNSGLYRVPAQGGTAEVALAPSQGELAFHDISPLPHRQGVVFVVQRQEENFNPMDTIAVWNPIEPARPKKVVFQASGSTVFNPVFSTSGHLIFTNRNWEQEENLWALPISSSTWLSTGEPFRLGDDGAFPAVSEDGTLALVHGQATYRSAARQLLWVDRFGRSGAPFGPIQRGLSLPRLSPDERFIAFTSGENNRSFRTWILDIAGDSALPLRPEGDSETGPHWLPSGRKIAVTAHRTNAPMSIIRSVEGGPASEAIEQGLLLHLSQSGRYAFLRIGPISQSVTNCYIRLSDEPSQPIMLPSGSPNLLNVEPLRPSLSPDDSILAFQSNESSRNEVWAVAFPGFTNRVRVSRGGGILPQWRRDGKELFYLNEDGTALLAVPVMDQNGRLFGEPVKLFDLPPSVLGGERATFFTSLFDASADGQRFLMMQNVKDSDGSESDTQPRVLLIQNWFDEYREKK